MNYEFHVLFSLNLAWLPPRMQEYPCVYIILKFLLCVSSMLRLLLAFEVPLVRSKILYDHCLLAQAIANLSVNANVAKAVADEGGITILAKLARSMNRLVAEEAAGGLWNLSVGEEHKVSHIFTSCFMFRCCFYVRGVFREFGAFFSRVPLQRQEVLKL